MIRIATRYKGNARSDKGIVGYVYAEVYQGLDSLLLNAYLHTLAVKQQHQRKGLGRALLTTMAYKLQGAINK